MQSELMKLAYSHRTRIGKSEGRLRFTISLQDAYTPFGPTSSVPSLEKHVLTATG